jgi:hypothetical protein
VVVASCLLIIIIIMDKLKPVLFGRTTKDLWPYIHPMAWTGWAILCLFPRWEYTMQVVLLPPLMEAVLYTILLVSMMIVPPDLLADESSHPDINSMESMFGMFQNPDVFFIGESVVANPEYLSP